MERWDENARAKRAADAFPAECSGMNEHLSDTCIDSPSEANMRVRSTAVFSNVEVDKARDGSNK